MNDSLSHGNNNSISLEPHTPFRILSLDGGGIRGAFTAAVVEEMEKRLGRPANEVFDLFAGTSTGAIVAAGLAAGQSASRIVQFYRTHGPRIFTRPLRARTWKRWVFSRTIDQKLEKFGIDGDWLFSSKFEAVELKNALKTVFLDDPLETIVASRLVIPSVDLVKGQTVVFKTPHLPNLDRDRHFKIVDILLATTAAPTYFPSASINEGSKYIDGGVWANNPTVVAVAEAVKILQQDSHTIGIESARSKLEVLSVGTGKAKAYLQPPKGQEGIAWWLAGRLIDVMMLSQSQGIDFQSQYLLGDSYSRLDFDLPDSGWKLDNTDVIEQLIHFGRETAKSNLAVFDRFLRPRQETSFRRYP